MNNSISRYNTVLMICLGAVAILCFLWFLSTREIRHLQPQVVAYQQRELVLKQLVGEVVAFSEKNPSIDPILVSIGAKQPKTAAPSPLKK